MADEKRIGHLQQRAEQAERLVDQLKNSLMVLQRRAAEKNQSAMKKEATLLECENVQLKKEVDDLRQLLVDLETRNGVVQVPLSIDAPPVAVSINAQSKPSVETTVSPSVEPTQTSKQSAPSVSIKEAKKEKPKKAKSPATKTEGSASRPVDISRIDLRVGKIIHCEKHPDADTLYVEQIDVGEESPRTVCSGLVEHIPLEKMQQRMVVVMCNLKPVTMRGVVSAAMVMCASAPDKCEIIDPPINSIEGERVEFEGYTGEPDAVLNPKKKIFEQVKPDLYTDANCVATYKGIPFTITGKGVCTVQSMKNSGIK